MIRWQRRTRGDQPVYSGWWSVVLAIITLVIARKLGIW